jgi:D-alanyl-D-alanine carboxypeptidase/D-alanyl-D-alanine-endopeptidase (penicillin-binding protein 4)
MRCLISCAVAVVSLLAGPTSALGAPTQQNALRHVFASDLNAAGGSNSAYVLDLSTRAPLYSYRARTGRLPASVEKLYTTSTALLRFGASTRLQTTILATGEAVHGVWRGDLYLRGGGDPTFGSRSFDSYAYGAGATMQQLVSRLVRSTGMKSLSGHVIGDESYFDALRGTAPYGYQVATDIGGPLSALEYDRGLADEQGTAFQTQPATFAAEQLVLALRAAGVRVPNGSYRAASTPVRARQVAAVSSPTIASLIRMTNAPSDNLFAEMLLKGLGARFAHRGSSSAGASIVKAQLATFGIHPALEDGSGLSRRDFSSPVQIVTLLAHMAANADFVRSLAVSGQTGTLADRLVGTPAAGRCHAKTGTLHDVSALAGYCLARDGHEIAFAILQNAIDPTAAHPLQDDMATALAKYDG